MMTTIESISALNKEAVPLSAQDVLNDINHIAPLLRNQSGHQFRLLSRFDASDATKEQVVHWFHTLAMSPSEVDVVSISHREGARMPLALFIEYYYCLWYPSSHDVAVVNKIDNFVLILTHEEDFSYYAY